MQKTVSKKASFRGGGHSNLYSPPRTNKKQQHTYTYLSAYTHTENSFGKGLIQGAFPLSDGSGVVLTVAKYLTPKLTEIQVPARAPLYVVYIYVLYVYMYVCYECS